LDPHAYNLNVHVVRRSYEALYITYSWVVGVCFSIENALSEVDC
jgi:hypothetical protein